MGSSYKALTPELSDFIREQLVFFTATAPHSGRVNVSPKGMDTFRIIDSGRVAYLDMTGSGNETAAHIRENGRITLMFCSFGNKAMTLRLYGRGRVVRPGAPDWDEMHALFGPPIVGERQIMEVAIDSVGTSCGYGVPRAESLHPRDTLIRYWENKRSEVAKCWVRYNTVSIDGLPTGISDPIEPGKQ